MTAPAVIVPYRDDRSQSLRYMLRSLANLAHGEVIVVGDRINWLTGVTNIETPKGQRYARNHDSVFSDSQQSRLVAAAHVGKGYAYLIDDDMFIMRPVDWIGPAHRGPAARTTGSYWYETGAETAKWLKTEGVEQTLCFETHVPLLVDVELLLGVADRIKATSLRSVWLRSAYGNLIAGRNSWEIRDPKVAGTGTRPHPSWPIWSTSDQAFTGGLAGRMICRAFHEPSPYERLG